MGREQADRGHRQQMIEAAQWMEEPGQEAACLTVPGMGECDAGCEQQGDCHKQTKCRSGHGFLLETFSAAARNGDPPFLRVAFCDFRRMVATRTSPQLEPSSVKTPPRALI
jgi:hypothetical protein